MRLRRGRREDLEHQLNQSALWAVSYGDLMSYLMIFFLVLYAFSFGKTQGSREKKRYEETLASIQRVFGGKVNEKLEQKASQREREEIAGQRLEQAIEEKELSKYVDVKISEEKVRLQLKEPILFDSGRAALKTEAVPVLQEIALELSKLPNPIVIAGHTDDVPIRGGQFSSNWELSMARAYAVIRFFESRGVDPKQLSGIGYGEHRPLAENASAEGRLKNRRIEIELIRAQ